MAERITRTQQGLAVPERPLIPFIEGDGSGRDIWPAAVRVFEAAVQKAYGSRRKVAWMEVLAGEKAQAQTGSWLPAETVAAFRELLVGIKGPLSTPVGGGHRSLNVALRQSLDLYVCLRPVRFFPGAPSPVLRPEAVDMVVFRENTEDVYAGLELQAGSPEAGKLSGFVEQAFGWKLPGEVGLGLKPISRAGSERLVRAAIRYALGHGRRSVTLVHKGNIQKFTEGAFRQWGYELARREFAGQVLCADEPEARAPEARAPEARAPEAKLLIKDVIADIFFQQVLTRAEEFDVIATTNLNGDYISDALAAQVGGIGIAPGANINYETGCALFEATHGTAPKYAGKDMVNPSSLVLSGAMMFDYLGWREAASLIEKGLAGAIASRILTYDFARLMPGARQVSTSEFANTIVRNME